MKRSDMYDFRPETRTLANLVEGVREDQLSAATPCSESSLGDLLDHVDGLSMGFTLAAKKETPEGGGRASANASQLGNDWRSRIPTRLEGLAVAWDEDSAWSGMTKVGGIDLPGEIAGAVALDEVIVHGWDIAVASGQSFEWDPELVGAALEFVAVTAAGNPEGTPGLFGPPVSVSPDASIFDRLLGLTGRDLSWADADSAG
jgi:uncharacterized protein (TIGR03086 family)